MPNVNANAKYNGIEGYKLINYLLSFCFISDHQQGFLPFLWLQPSRRECFPDAAEVGRIPQAG